MQKKQFSVFKNVECRITASTQVCCAPNKESRSAAPRGEHLGLAREMLSQPAGLPRHAHARTPMHGVCMYVCVCSPLSLWVPGQGRHQGARRSTGGGGWRKEKERCECQKNDQLGNFWMGSQHSRSKRKIPSRCVLQLLLHPWRRDAAYPICSVSLLRGLVCPGKNLRC